MTAAQTFAAETPARSCACPTLDAETCRAVRYGHGPTPEYLKVPPCDCVCHTDYDASTEIEC